MKDSMSQKALKRAGLGCDVFLNHWVLVVPVNIKGDSQSRLKRGTYLVLINKAFASYGNVAEAQTCDKHLLELHHTVFQNEMQEMLGVTSANAQGVRLEGPIDL